MFVQTIVSYKHPVVMVCSLEIIAAAVDGCTSDRMLKCTEKAKVIASFLSTHDAVL